MRIVRISGGGWFADTAGSADEVSPNVALTNGSGLPCWARRGQTGSDEAGWDGREDGRGHADHVAKLVENFQGRRRWSIVEPSRTVFGKDDVGWPRRWRRTAHSPMAAASRRAVSGSVPVTRSNTSSRAGDAELGLTRQASSSSRKIPGCGRSAARVDCRPLANARPLADPID